MRYDEANSAHLYRPERATTALSNPRTSHTRRRTHPPTLSATGGFASRNADQRASTAARSSAAVADKISW